MLGGFAKLVAPFQTASSLLMPSKYSAQKTFQFHGLKAVLVRKNFCLKEMYKTISWGVGKPNMNIAIFIGGKKNRHKSSLTYARFSHSLPSHSFTTKLDISLQKNFPSIEFDNKRGGSLIIEEETATFYNLFFTRVTFFYFLDKAVCLSQGTLTRAEDESICGA